MHTCVVHPDSGENWQSLLPVSNALRQTNRRLHAATLCRAGQYNESIRWFELSEQVTPLRAWDMLLRGIALVKLGKNEQALQSLEQAKE